MNPLGNTANPSAPSTTGAGGQQNRLILQIQQQLAAKGKTLEDFKQAVQQTGNPMQALQKLGVTLPGMNLPAGSQAKQVQTGRYGQASGNRPINTVTSNSMGSTAPLGANAEASSTKPLPAVRQMIEQQLAAKGLTLNDVKKAVEKTGDPALALQQLGIVPPRLNVSA